MIGVWDYRVNLQGLDRVDFGLIVVGDGGRGTAGRSS